jgi:mRNA interferase MazF
MKTKRPSATSNNYQFGDVVVAPFPFSDITHAKHRPLVILAPSQRLGAHPAQHLGAMITSSRLHWDSDIPIRDYDAAGLNVPCHIRLKLFTLDERLLARSIGQLTKRDAKALRQAITKLLAER